MNFKIILLTSICFLLTWSCKKQYSELDQISQQMGNNLYSYAEVGHAVSFNNDTFYYLDTTIGLPIKLNKTVGGDDSVFATVDNSLVQAYNQLYEENNPSFPIDAFKASNSGKFIVKGGKNIAEDSLYVEINNASGLTDSTTYLVPVKLSEKSGNGLATSLFYFKIQVVFSDLYVKISGGSGYPFYFNGGMLFSNFLFSESDGNISGPGTIKIAVSLNGKFPLSDVYIDGEALNDTATLNQYGSYLPFPNNTFNLTKSRVRIPANTLNAVDSIEVNTGNYSIFKQYVSYLLAVKLTPDTTTQYTPSIDPNYSTAYISFYSF